MCWINTKVIPVSGGSAFSKAVNASRPPAEAPIPTTGKTVVSEAFLGDRRFLATVLLGTLFLVKSRNCTVKTPIRQLRNVPRFYGKFSAPWDCVHCFTASHAQRYFSQRRGGVAYFVGNA
jgi:hypothetical protein